MSRIPPPPVPRTVRELLQDYPELIQRLQEDLKKSHNGPLGALDLDRTIWLLKDMLESDWIDARRERERAKARGDEEAARQAEKKRLAIGEAMHNVIGDGDLVSHFNYGRFV